MANPSRMKREIDKAKRERAAEKRERRQQAANDDRTGEPGGVTPASTRMPLPTNDEVFQQLEQIHAQFDANELSFEAFERAKETLLSQLTTD